MIVFADAFQCPHRKPFNVGGNVLNAKITVIRQAVDFVDKILVITKSSDYLENPAKTEEVKEYEKQIDQLVYKLYDLAPDEIKIIEESVK